MMQQCTWGQSNKLNPPSPMMLPTDLHISQHSTIVNAEQNSWATGTDLAQGTTQLGPTLYSRDTRTTLPSSLSYRPMPLASATLRRCA